MLLINIGCCFSSHLPSWSTVSRVLSLYTKKWYTALKNMFKKCIHRDRNHKYQDWWWNITKMITNPAEMSFLKEYLQICNGSVCVVGILLFELKCSFAILLYWNFQNWKVLVILIQLLILIYFKKILVHKCIQLIGLFSYPQIFEAPMLMS